MKLKAAVNGVTEFLDNSVVLEIKFEDEKKRKFRRMNTTEAWGTEDPDAYTKQPFGDEPIKGKITLYNRSGSPKYHIGIMASLIAEIVDTNDMTVTYNLFKEMKEISGPDAIPTKKQHFKFEFKEPRVYESYHGRNVSVSYYIKVVMSREDSRNNVVTKGLWNYPPEKIIPIQLEVGIEDCMHVIFVYDRDSYDVNGVVTGKVTFKQVRINVKVMELAVIRKEYSGTEENPVLETDTLAHYEIMDGLPTEGTVIPIRLYLQPLNLTPTLNKIDDRFSYYLSLIIIDHQDRRYFKQQEIKLYRSN